jgi:hypothetical protein
MTQTEIHPLSEIKHLACQTTITAHIDGNGLFGPLSNLRSLNCGNVLLDFPAPVPRLAIVGGGAQQSKWCIEYRGAFLTELNYQSWLRTKPQQQHARQREIISIEVGW